VLRELSKQVGAGGEMNQALYAHMNNKRKMKKKKLSKDVLMKDTYPGNVTPLGAKSIYKEKY
jgi:hypothetical protein